MKRSNNKEFTLFEKAMKKIAQTPKDQVDKKIENLNREK